MLSEARAQRLKPLLDAFAKPEAWAGRIIADPLEFPRRYRDPRDVEVVGLLSTALAYGRASFFKPKIHGLLEQMGRSPAAFVSAMTVSQAKTMLKGFVYRFNVPTDLGVLLMGMGQTLQRFGSLENAFIATRTQSLQPSLGAFTATIREAAPLRELTRALGPTRGLSHLLPSAAAGAAKRLNLYLRWMVRGPDAMDVGVWKQISPADLIIPVDTHVGRIAQWLALTTQKTISWAMAEEITASLRRLDPADPVRYDFALCHYGMSGACPITPVKVNCRVCALRAECRIGRRLVPS